MATTRDMGRHRSPILISDSPSPSPPPPSRNKVNSSSRPQGVVKLPQRASSAQPQEIGGHGRMQQWINYLPPSNKAGTDVGPGLDSNSANAGGQPTLRITDFTHNIGGPLAPPAVNAGRKLVPRVPGLTYDIGPPQPPPPALVPRPMPNIAKPDDSGRQLPPNSILRASNPNDNVVPSLPVKKLPLPSKSILRASKPYNNAVPSLPVQTLPFNVKHSILCTMQKIMEEALFDWAKKWVPVLLQMEGWETPEAGELNHWLRKMKRYSIPPDAFSQSAGMDMRALEGLLKGRLHDIRHIAVHRRPTTVSMLKEMLADSQLLTKTLRDVPRTEKLWAMQLALEEDDPKWMEKMIATPISAFTRDFDPKKFRTQPRPSGNYLQQKENMRLEHSVEGQENIVHERGPSAQTGLRNLNVQPKGLKRKRSESIKMERAKQQAGVIKNPGDVVDLTTDSDDENLPDANPQPAKLARVIDLTGDESAVVLFRSPRASGMMDG